MDTRLSYKEPLHNYRSRCYNSILLSIFWRDEGLDEVVDEVADSDAGVDEDSDAGVDEDSYFFC